MLGERPALAALAGMGLVVAGGLVVTLSRDATTAPRVSKEE